VRTAVAKRADLAAMEPQSRGRSLLTSDLAIGHGGGRPSSVPPRLEIVGVGERKRKKREKRKIEKMNYLFF
jgi:hypothetical protein